MKWVYRTSTIGAHIASKRHDRVAFIGTGETLSRHNEWWTEETKLRQYTWKKRLIGMNGCVLVQQKKGARNKTQTAKYCGGIEGVDMKWIEIEECVYEVGR